MWMQIIAGAAWLIWLSSGTAGLEKGLTVGALLVIGLGMKNILDTFWKRKSAERNRVGTDYGEEDFTQPASHSQGISGGSRWTNARTESALTSPALRGLGRRVADPRA